MIEELTQTEFDQKIGEKHAALVEFYTPTCSHCKKLAGALNQLSEEIDGETLIAKCNIAEASFLQERFDITAVPTLIFFKDGQEANKLVGEIHPLIIKEEIKKLA